MICPECNFGMISKSFEEYHCNNCGYDWNSGDYEEIDRDIFNDETKRDSGFSDDDAF